MKQTSPFLRAHKPSIVYIGLLILLYLTGSGEAGSGLIQILGLPWTFFFQSANLPPSDLKLFLNFEAGAWINAVVIYLISVWLYSRKRSA